MLRRDYIQAEMQKLAQVLARIMGLKRDGLDEEATTLLEHTLKESFGLDSSEITDKSADAFIESVRNKTFPAEKADLLAKFLFESVQPLRAEDRLTVPTLLKVLALFDLLEKDYHQQSLENLQRRSTIVKYLKENHE